MFRRVRWAIGTFAVLGFFPQLAHSNADHFAHVGRYVGEIYRDEEKIGICALDFHKDLSRHSAHSIDLSVFRAFHGESAEEILNLEVPLGLLRRWLTSSLERYELRLDQQHSIVSKGSFESLSERRTRIKFQLSSVIWSTLFRDVSWVVQTLEIVPDISSQTLTEIGFRDRRGEELFNPAAVYLFGERLFPLVSCHIQMTVPGLEVRLNQEKIGRVVGGTHIEFLANASNAQRADGTWLTELVVKSQGRLPQAAEAR